MRKSKLESLATEWEGRAREYRKQTKTLLPNRAGNREGESLLWRARAYESCAEELRLALNAGAALPAEHAPSTTQRRWNQRAGQWEFNEPAWGGWCVLRLTPRKDSRPMTFAEGLADLLWHASEPAQLEGTLKAVGFDLFSARMHLMRGGDRGSRPAPAGTLHSVTRASGATTQGPSDNRGIVGALQDLQAMGRGEVPSPPDLDYAAAARTFDWLRSLGYSEVQLYNFAVKAVDAGVRGARGAAPREPSPTKQKFHAGDLVRVAANTGHWADARDAIVGGSYRDLYEGHGSWGENDERTYSLYFEEVGGAAWYDESDLMLLARGRFDLWERWRNARRAAFEARVSGNAVSDKGLGVGGERAADPQGP